MENMETVIVYISEQQSYDGFIPYDLPDFHQTLRQNKSWECHEQIQKISEVRKGISSIGSDIISRCCGKDIRISAAVIKSASGFEDARI